MRKLLFFLHFLAFSSFAQTESFWTLQNCIDTAYLNNSKIRVSDLNLSIAEVNLKSEQLSFLPTINGNASHGYNFGQTIDLFTNQFATSRVQYNNFYLSSSIILFSGLSNYYSKEIADLDLSITKLNLKIEKRNIAIDIMGAYLQVKLNEEILDLNIKHLDFTKTQVKKIKLLESLNYEPRRKRLELEAQESKDEYQLILAKNDLEKSLFLLQTLIGKMPDSTFKLSDSIFFESQLSVNELFLNELYAKQKLMESKQLKGQLSPSISLNGSLGTGYSENNKFVTTNGEFSPKPFNEQVDENFYQSISATLTIPIFNGVNSYSRIKIKKLEYQKVKVENQERISQRKNKILQYQLEIFNYKEAIRSVQSSYDFQCQIFLDSRIQYDNNVIDYYTYLQSKDAFLKTESELIQASYRLKFAKLVLLTFK